MVQSIDALVRRLAPGPVTPGILAAGLLLAGLLVAAALVLPTDGPTLVPTPDDLRTGPIRWETALRLV